MGRIQKAQVASMNLHYRYFPWEYFLDSVAANGLTRIELWAGAPHFYIGDVRPGDVRRLSADLSRRGLTVVCFTPEQCIYPINIASREKVLRERSVRYLEKCIDVAADLGCPLLLVTSGLGYFSEGPEEAWKLSRQSLSRLARKAARAGILLALEPLRTDESNLVNNLASLQKMLREVSSPVLKGMIDTIPMAIAGETIADYHRALGSDLVHIHFVDGKPRGHLAWGDGVLPLDQYMRTLEDTDYRGALTLEITDSSYIMDPAMADARSIQTLQPYLAQ